MHPQAQIEFVKAKILQKQQPYYQAYLQLRAYADSALGHESHALQDFNVPGYYIDSAMHRSHSRSLQTDAFDAYACALAYQLSGEEKYARKSMDFLMDWAHTNKQYSNHDGSLVMAYSGSALVMAAELLLPYEGWASTDQQQFFKWVKQVYRKASHEIRDKHNNWADWGRFGSLLSAHLLDDTLEVAETIRLIQSDLSRKIAPDGHMPEEVKREKNGLWYTYFSLAPITAACWIALQAEGTDLFSSQQHGKSIQSALDYLLYHQQHPEEWSWYQHPRTGSPDSWPGNLLEAMHGIYGKEAYSTYVHQTRPLSYPVHHFAWTFPTLMKPMRNFGAQGGQELETLRNTVIAELLSTATDSSQVENLLQTQQENGSWPGINYEDVSRTGFQHSEHLDHMLSLSTAYRQQNSGYYLNPQLKESVGKALDFWLAHDFICDNWWWNQIGTPEHMVGILLLMDDALTETQKTKAVPIAGRANLEAWGARPGGDRIKIAGIWGRLGLFLRDSSILEQVVNTMTEEIRFSSERGTPDDVRGLQQDFSFHHRKDRVTSTLSYGLGYAQAFADWAARVAGSTFQFPQPAMQLLVDFYLDGICQHMVYATYPDPGAKNRSITRKGTLHAYSTDIPEKLLQATSYRRDELEKIIRIRKEEQQAALRGSRFFWHSEYFSHQRPQYFTSVRMYSSRNHNMEEPYNEEGLKNHHLADGSNFISRTGREYTDIFPAWDWQKIPGTTVVQKPALPSPEEIQKKGLTTFVGAVTDRNTGAAAFDFQSPHDSLQGKKAWFFFENEFVCLGSGIQSQAAHTVQTTLNQCLLTGEVTVGQHDKTSVLQMGTHKLSNVSWVLHDSVAYLFPAPAPIMLGNEKKSGSWRSINRQSEYTDEAVEKDIFTLGLDHGIRPRQATYAYVVLPATDVQSLEKYSSSLPLEILANTPEQQAVRHHSLELTQVVFYRPGNIQLTEKVSLTAVSPGLVMVQTDGDKIKKISVADPGRELKTMHLKITTPLEGQGDHWKAVWHEEKGYSEMTIDLPQQAYAGKSRIISLQSVSETQQSNTHE